MDRHTVVSTDSHIIEVPDLWTSRVESRFADRAPRLVQGETAQRWYADGQILFSVAGGVDVGLRFEHPEKLRLEANFEEVHLGAYVPEAKLKDMDADGVFADVIFPTCGLHVYSIPDGELLSAVCRAYNDYVAEFCAGHLDRIRGIAMINLDDIEEGTRELRRAAKLGTAGAMIPVYPPEDRPYDSAIYDPFWAAAQELGIPLSLHIGTVRKVIQTVGRSAQDAVRVDDGLRSPVESSSRTHLVQLSVARMIYSGVFHRFPGLRVGVVEFESGWLPYFLQAMDFNHTQRARKEGSYFLPRDVMPSSVFHANMFVSFQEDEIGIRCRDLIGVDNMVWGSDYPHQESTFPRSRQILDELFEGVPDVEREKITSSNAAKLYGFALPAAA